MSILNSTRTGLFGVPLTREHIKDAGFKKILYNGSTFSPLSINNSFGDYGIYWIPRKKDNYLRVLYNHQNTWLFIKLANTNHSKNDGSEKEPFYHTIGTINSLGDFQKILSTYFK